eukprot:15708549-Heterocapsa_arctica.AAC.1
MGLCRAAGAARGSKAGEPAKVSKAAIPLPSKHEQLGAGRAWPSAWSRFWARYCGTAIGDAGHLSPPPAA